MKKRKRKLRIILYAFGLIFLFLLVYLITLYIQVSADASDRIERGVIDSIIFSESPVYYEDGKTPIGVFFERTHRQYIPYKETPKTFIKALIATEDKRYFEHPGFDILAIARALITNYGGGSTITQQTAKSIFKREKESIITIKIKELIQALLLENKYSKEEILEMYINQSIPIRGYGRGLIIAARYFFDKAPQDLDLVECAFIAGYANSLRYDPFLRKTEADREETKRIANVRKNYVLRAMRRNNFITEEEYLQAKEKDIPFNEGKITYDLSVVLDYVREQLESDYFRAILQDQGVENIATSGIKIYTSVNKEIQEGAMRSIRHHLPLLDVKLSGYGSRPVREGLNGVPGEDFRKSDKELPFPCRITRINVDPQNPSIVVAWNTGEGIVDYEGFRDIGDAWLKGKQGNWAKFDRRHAPDFLKTLHEGEVIEVQAREMPENHDQTRLMLSKKPELEGGIVVLHKGMIKAMVGGFENQFFNRAADAKRQLGSIFKPLVYSAALQLKWNNLDPLTNMRDLFQFENMPYVPKPDHKPEANRVSLAWAGVKSENLATVWLLYHLTDKLNMGEFRQVAELLGLAREETESYDEYVRRIRDRHGVVVDRDALMEAAFHEAGKEVETDLIFLGHDDALGNVRRLHFRVRANELNPEDPEESLIRRLDFQSLRTLNIDMKLDLRRIQDLLNSYPGNTVSTPTIDLREALNRFCFTLDTDGKLRLVYTDGKSPTNRNGLNPITPEWILARRAPMHPKEIWIDGIIPSEVIDLLQEHLTKNYEGLLEHKPYDLEVLSKVRDFRTLVNLTYVKHLSKEIGISSSLESNLSFPLGSDSISIIEAALAYHAIMTGDVYTLSDEMTPGMVPLITKITDREGETIWEYRPQHKKVLSSEVSGQVSEILRMAIEEGTGQAAKDAVQLSLTVEGAEEHISIPAFGKTGTTNRNTNSGFVGFIPALQMDTSHLYYQEGYVIASYVGYDDNRPMEGEHVSIYGASGALPLWIDTANAIANSRSYTEGLQFADLVFDMPSTSMMNGEGLIPLEVSATTGLPDGHQDEKGSANLVNMLSYIEKEGDTIEPKRVFAPTTGADDGKVSEGY
jgi:penicillin-binding protein 1A